MSSNDSSTECFEVFNDQKYAAVVGIRAGAGAISMICCLGMIALIFLLKKHVFFTQRLILYLTLSTLAYSLVSIINVAGYKAYTSEALQGYCVFVGFLEQLISCWIPLAISCIVVDLFYKVIFERPSERLEIVYVIVIFASPLLYSWIPFIYLAYGQAGAWCWIRDSDYSDCSPLHFGTVLRFVIYWVPLLIIMIVLIVMLVIIVFVLRKKQQQWVGKFDPEVQDLQKRMRKEVLPLIAYPIIFLVLNIFPFANRIVNITTTDPVFVLWLFAAISLPLQGLVITIAFVADPETRSKLTLRQLLGAAKNMSDGKGEVLEYHTGDHDKEREIEHSTYD